MTRGSWVARATRNRSFALIWGAYALGCFAVAIWILFTPGVRDTIATRLGGFVFFVVPGVLLVRTARRCARAGVLVRDDDIVIRGPLKTWTVPIADAEEFCPGLQGGVGNGTGGIVLKVRDDRPIPIWTLAKESFVWNMDEAAEAFEPTADKLNALLRDARAKSPGSSEPAA